MNRTGTNSGMPLERLLIYLRLAIEEARLTRSVVETRLVLHGGEDSERTRARLAELDREIGFLENQIVDLSGRLERGLAA